MTADLRRLAEQAIKVDDGWWWSESSLRKLVGDDAAYIAAAHPQTILRMLDRVATLEEGLDKIKGLQPKAVDTFRRYGFVFDVIGPIDHPDELTRWKVLAFSLYTDLCEAEGEARALLAAAPSEPEWGAPGQSREQKKMEGERDPAALPAEVGERIQVRNLDGDLVTYPASDPPSQRGER